MRKENLKILAAFIVIAMISAVSVGDVPETVERTMTPEKMQRAIPSVLVWSENFDGGDISNWNFFEINWTLPEGTVNLTANPYDLFNVSEGVLRAIGPEWNFAAINSTIAYGTWNFDLDIQRADEFDHFGVEIIGEKFNETWLPEDHTVDGFRLSILIPDEDPDGVIRFVRGKRNTPTVFLGTFDVNNIRGWHNFTITRELTGQFHVYMDGIHIIEGLDNTTIRYEQFCFFGMANPAIDNITISDTIDYDAAPPTWDQPPQNQMINIGTDFYYDLNATDYSGIDQWWINDTVNFAINNDGVISNIEVLEAGSYVIEVSVNDTLGFTQTGVFRLTVRVSPPFPIELVIGGVGAVAVIILVLVIWRKRS